MRYGCQSPPVANPEFEGLVVPWTNQGIHRKLPFMRPRPPNLGLNGIYNGVRPGNFRPDPIRLVTCIQTHPSWTNTSQSSRGPAIWLTTNSWPPCELMYHFAAAYPAQILRRFPKHLSIDYAAQQPRAYSHIQEIFQCGLPVPCALPWEMPCQPQRECRPPDYSAAMVQNLR